MLKPPSCQGCPLFSLGEGFSTPDGKGTSGVAIIGEALGYDERIDGLPFRPYAPAGSKLEEIFRLASSQSSRPISRNQFLLWNIIACRPPGNELVGSPYEARAIEHCRVHFDNAIGKNLNSLFALGNTPLKSLTGVSGIAKEKQSISNLRGFVFQSKYGMVVPSFHPAFLKRGNNHLTPIVVNDLLRVLDVARGTYTNYPGHRDYVPPVYQTSPGLDEAWSFYYKVRDNSKLVLTFDIETPDSSDVEEDERDELANQDIVMVQFSISKGTGIAFPYRDEYIKIIHSLLGLPNVKSNHNTYNFDNPRLYAKGIRIGGIVHDTMWMFKHWHSRLPRGLQSVASMFGFPFPWKHLYKSNLNYYGCADVDAVQWILHYLPPLMKQRGVWDGYKRHILSLHPILDRGRNFGIPVSEEKRLATIDTFRAIRTDLNTKLQKEIPDEIRNIKPKRKDKATGLYDYGYIREPKKVREGIQYYNSLVARIQENDGGAGRNILSLEDFLFKRYGLAYVEFKTDGKDADANVNPRATTTVQSVNRWAIFEPFKGSSTQLIKYLNYKRKEITKAIELLLSEREEKYQGRNPELTSKINELKDLADSYKVPQNFKTKKDTTAKGELEELYEKNGDLVLGSITEIRSLDTNLNNYVPNWKPSSDGRVHTTFGFTAPTGQLDSRRPNILNCSKHTKYGNLFRSIIEAPTGYVFVEFDKKCFHVATMGYCANDKTYVKFAQMDPHSILGSYIDPSIIGGTISLKWPDEEILRSCKEFKKRCKSAEEDKNGRGINVRQALAKPTVLGNQLGLGAKKLYYQNRRFMESVEEAERLQKLVAELFPKVELYKKHIKDKAFEQKFLISEFGFIQHFYNVYQFKYNKHTSTWERKDGEGRGPREPIAFRVQGCAFGMIQCEMLELERLGFNEEFNWINSIHDSLIFMPEVGKLDKCIEEVKKVMNRGCKWLVNESTGEEGLVVKVDVSVGRNWMGHDEIKNREGMKEI